MTLTKIKTNYLIEFRFFGKSKQYVKDISKDIGRKFDVTQRVRRGKPAHVTLFGPFNAKNENKLIQKFAEVCKRHDIIEYQLDNFNNFEERVVYLDVNPSNELIDLRKDLSQTLRKITYDYPSWDKEDDFKFHCTIVRKDISHRFDKIWKYLQKLETPKFEQYLLRVTLLKKGQILKEYDFIQRNMFRRDEALSRHIQKRTFDFLKEIRDNNGERITDELNATENSYFISDLHFDHTNIIKYCNRPFKNTTQMNKTMLNNWNKTVGKNGTIYFLGDMSFGRGSRPAYHWIKKLNGKIEFIEGNHEQVGNIDHYPSAHNVFLNYNGEKFLLVHDPSLKPKSWNGWTIHGHKHNNDLKNYPFINRGNKTTNVSAELVNYIPLKIDEIISKIESKETFFEKIKSWLTKKKVNK